MPKFSRRVRRFARRGRNRRRALMNKRRRKRRVPRPLTLGFPKSKLTKLRYVDQILLNPSTAGSIATNYFRANSAYDPDFTLGGHQPLFYDQFAVAYDHYTVLGSKITVKPMPSSTTSPVGTWGIYLDDQSVNEYTTVPALIESNQSGGTWKNVSPAAYTTRSSLSKTFSTSKFFHVNKGALNAGTRFVAGIGSNPTEDALFCLWYGAPPAAGGVSMYFMVQIDYIVRFSEPKYVAQS